jgi:hypothetical protein
MISPQIHHDAAALENKPAHASLQCSATGARLPASPDNSPALQRWEPGSGAHQSRRDERKAARLPSLRDSHVEKDAQPSAEALGYSQKTARLQHRALFAHRSHRLVEAPDYSMTGSTKINARVPAATTGNIIETIVTMLINGSLRDGSYTTVLLPS